MTKATDIPNSQLWNVARSIASTALDVAAANISVNEDTTFDNLDHDAVTEAFEHAASDHDVWPFADTDDLLAVVNDETSLQGTPDDNYGLAKRVNGRLKTLRDPNESETFDTERGDNGAEITTAELENPELEIATDIYYCLLGDESTSYPDIKQQYDSPFPDSSVALTRVLNTSGDTQERIDEIADWVGEWVNDTENVGQMNRDIHKLQ